MTDLIARLEAAEKLTAKLLWDVADATKQLAKADRLKELARIEAWLEAAVLLVPEGWSWRVQYGPAYDRAMAALIPPADVIGDYCVAKTPALALLIAILKATGSELIEEARGHVMTPEERRAQRISWVYGQLMDCAPEVTREQVAKIVDEDGA